MAPDGKYTLLFFVHFNQNCWFSYPLLRPMVMDGWSMAASSAISMHSDRDPDPATQSTVFEKDRFPQLGQKNTDIGFAVVGGLL